MLHYTTYEHPTSTEWVTFVHGAGGSSSIWFKQVRAFQQQYNVLLVDLRGHGRSKLPMPQDIKRYNFDFITADVIQVLDHLQIKKTHLVGISLGTIIIREMAESYPDRVQSMIMGGAVMQLNLRGKILMRLGVWFKNVIPYLILYKFFAFVIMPKRNHKESRSLFVREAKKLYQKEFIRWFKLAADINQRLKWFRLQDADIPTLYLMGEEDHMFLPSVRLLAQQHESAQLVVVSNSGHVVNVEQPEVFNRTALDFLRQH